MEGEGQGACPGIDLGSICHGRGDSPENTLAWPEGGSSLQRLGRVGVVLSSDSPERHGEPWREYQTGEHGAGKPLNTARGGPQEGVGLGTKRQTASPGGYSPHCIVTVSAL